MNNIHLISFGCDKYKNSIKRLYNEANDSKWFNSITIYTQKILIFNLKINIKIFLITKKGMDTGYGKIILLEKD